MASDSTHWIVTLVCRDQPGIVHAVSGAIVEAAGNITESQQFSSDDTGTFFIRLQVESAVSREAFEAALAPVTDRYGMTWRLDVVGRPLRTLVLVSTAAHCLNDLLFRQRAGQLPVELPLVLANHPDLAELAAFYDVPFEAHPVKGADAEGGVRAPRAGGGRGARHRAGRARPLHADPVAGTVRRPRAAGSSTSITRSCPASRARTRTSRRTPAA